MAEEAKTIPNAGSVEEFLSRVENEQRRADTQSVIAMMQRATGQPPTMWGDAIVGFGRQQYRYTSGRTGEWFRCGLSPRKQNLTLYLGWGFDGLESYLARLGKYTLGKGCLYLKRLSDVDAAVLEEMVSTAVRRPAPAGVTITGGSAQ